MVQIVKYSFIWGSKVVPQDVKEVFDGPLVHFWSPWEWAEDGPEIVSDLSLPLGVTWENLYNDLYTLLNFGAEGEILLVDTGSENIIVKMILGGTIIVTSALTVEGARAAATKEIYFPEHGGIINLYGESKPPGVSTCSKHEFLNEREENNNEPIKE